LGSAVSIFRFLVPLELPPVALCGRSHNVVGENADQHPSLPPEHCTLALNVKTDDFKRIDFSNERPAGQMAK
jgi:hypothetical protein